MNRLWTICAITLIGGAGALVSGVVASASLWPGVGLFSVAGLLACAAARIDAAAESAKHEAELDSKADDERLSVLESKVEHIEKKDALTALG